MNKQLEEINEALKTTINTLKGYRKVKRDLYSASMDEKSRSIALELIRREISEYEDLTSHLIDDQKKY